MYGGHKFKPILVTKIYHSSFIAFVQNVNSSRSYGNTNAYLIEHRYRFRFTLYKEARFLYPVTLTVCH